MKEEIRKTYNENGIVWFRCTEKFSEELHKYINTHNESTTILVYSKEDSMWMEETYTGKWMGKKFKMTGIATFFEPPDHEFFGSLSQFIELIKTKKITELSFLDNLEIDDETIKKCGFEIKEINWSPELTEKEKKEVNTRNLINDYNYYSDEIGDDLNTLNEICGDKSGIVNTEIMFKKEWICHISVQIGKKIFALTS